MTPRGRFGTFFDEIMYFTRYFLVKNRLQKKHYFHAVFEPAQKVLVLPYKLQKMVPEMTQNDPK